MKEKKYRNINLVLNLDYTYKIVVSTTMCDSIYSSTRTTSKHKINDQCVVNDQIDAHGSCSYRNYEMFISSREITKDAWLHHWTTKRRL